MQSRWRDINDRILDKVGRVRRVGFLISSVCKRCISFKTTACVSRVSEKDINRYDAARRSPARTAICDGRHATVMHLVVSWFVSTGTFDFKVLIKDRLCTRRGILSMVNSVHDLLEWQLHLFFQECFFIRTWIQRA